MCLEPPEARIYVNLLQPRNSVKTSQATLPNQALYDYTAAFRRSLRQLNKAQRAAVEQIDGAVMVLAGPGTGKTQLLATRIGNILLQTDARAANILCLTFTDAGVKAMRQRLLQLIGPEAHRVPIYTFHGFCNMVIQERMEYFGKPRLEPLSELERIRIIRDMLDKLDVHHPLRQGKSDGYFYEKHLFHLFRSMKAENWTVEDMQQNITDYLAELPERPELQYQRRYKQFKKGDLKQALLDAEQQKMALLAAAIDLYPDYAQRLENLARYDFDDMIQWVLKGFKQYPSLLRSYQERYLYLLVDEFQDTNGAQNEIVRLLASYWERPNVFIVGDDDQAIYEFQGARLQSMIDFSLRYEEVQLVTLTQNYRSKPAILKAASSLIKHNQLRLAKQIQALGTPIDKKLLAADPQLKNAKDGIKIREYDNIGQENTAVLAQIRQWQAAGIPYSEMAVIYYRHKQADYLQQLLAAAGIPFVTNRPTNVLDELVVRQLRELLSYFHLEQSRPFSAEHLLYRLLHFRCFEAAPLLLAQLSLHLAREKKTSQEDQNNKTYWRELLQDEAIVGSQLKALGDWLEDCIGSLDSLPLLRFIEKVLNGSGLLAWLSRGNDRALQLAVMSSFLDFIRLELVRRPRLDLAGLLETFTAMEANQIGIPLRNQLSQADAVQLVTAHSAKGLEFSCVWILDASDKIWNAAASVGNKRQFSLPDTLTLTGEADETEARRRLFFVAMTRAKSDLIISYAQLDEQGKAQSPALFISELQAANPKLRSEAAPLEEEEINAQLLLRLGSTTAGEPPPFFEAEAIAELLKDYRLSISALNNYLFCPLGFFYENILKVPSFERVQATYGNALHEALQDYFLRMRADPYQIFPSESELLYYFEQAMERRRSRFESASYEGYLQKGRRELATYYKSYRDSWTAEVKVEQRIGLAEVKGVPLTGIIDRIDILSDYEVRILDYKSGTQSKDRLRAPTPANPQGGSYWRQLIFYKLLYENQSGMQQRVTASAISFLALDSQGEQPTISIDIGRKDLDEFTELLQESWKKIQAQEFTGCGKDNCSWCRFVADQSHQMPAVGSEKEAMDDEAG